MKTTIPFLFIIFFISISCNNNGKKKEYPNATKITLNNIEESVALKCSDLYDSISFVKLETTNKSIIGRIDKMIYYQNKYFILDIAESKSVLAFNSNGKYLRRIGRNGKGPEEYDQPNDITIDPFTKSIVIWHNNAKRLLYYDLEGKFQKSIAVDYYISSFSILDKNKFAYYFDNRENRNVPEKSKFNLLVVDTKGKHIFKALPYNNLGNFGFGSHNFFQRFNDDLLLSPGFKDTIFIVNEKSIIPKFIIDFGDQKLSNELRYNKIKFNKEIGKSNFAYLSKFFETPNYFVFTFVYKGKIYKGFYSKKSGKLKYGNMFLNDMYGLIEGTQILTHNQDLIINYWEPGNNVEYFKNILNNTLTDGVKIKKELLKMTELKGFSISDAKAFKEVLKNAEFKPTKKEIDFVNSINSQDNPILVIYKLKKF
jgi:hypothetical protein